MSWLTKKSAETKLKLQEMKASGKKARGNPTPVVPPETLALYDILENINERLGKGENMILVAVAVIGVIGVKEIIIMVKSAVGA